MYQIQTHANVSETETCIRIQAHFLVESRIDDFSVIWGVPLDAQTGVVVVGPEFSLPSSSSTIVGLAVVGPKWKSSEVDGKNGLSIPGWQILSISTAGSAQLKSMSSRSDSSYLFVSVPCAPTLESTSSLISNVPCCLGVKGTRPKWFSKTSCLWEHVLY